MALSTRKRNMIIADWKTGKFDNPSQVAKHYKIDRKTAGKIIEGISQDNTAIVEAGAIYENAKKSLKNPVEITAIETAVKEMTVADEIHSIVLDGTLENIKAVKKALTINDSDKDNVSLFDRKLGQETFDKALITAGKAPRFAPKAEINNTNNTQVNNDIDGYGVKLIEEA